MKSLILIFSAMLTLGTASLAKAQYCVAFKENTQSGAVVGLSRYKIKCDLGFSGTVEERWCVSEKCTKRLVENFINHNSVLQNYKIIGESQGHYIVSDVSNSNEHSNYSLLHKLVYKKSTSPTGLVSRVDGIVEHNAIFHEKNVNSRHEAVQVSLLTSRIGYRIASIIWGKEIQESPIIASDYFIIKN